MSARALPLFGCSPARGAPRVRRAASGRSSTVADLASVGPGLPALAPSLPDFGPRRLERRVGGNHEAADLRHRQVLEGAAFGRYAWQVEGDDVWNERQVTVPERLLRADTHRTGHAPAHGPRGARTTRTAGERIRRSKQMHRSHPYFFVPEARLGARMTDQAQG